MRLGRPVLPREVQVVFWDGVRAGLGVEEAAGAAGAGRETARRWVVAAGGVKGNGPVAGSGRFLARWEREEIAVGLAQKLPYRRIAARLAPGRSVSTVCREVRRNSVGGVYRAHLAEREALERARRPRPAKLAVNDELREWVQAKLMGNWSPEQVSARLVLEFPDRPEMRVSAETIYQSLYVQGRGALRRELARHLRTGRQMRRPRRAAGADGRGHLKDMVNISQRPAGAADRAVPGHWEGDLIEGRAWKSQIGTLVERTTRFTMLVPLPDGRSAAAVAAAVTPVIAGLPGALRRSLTECVRYFVRGGFSLSGSGCLSVTVFSRYLMPCCPVYPAVSRNRTFRAVPGLMLRVPVFPASCAVAGACCLILRGSHGGPSRVSLSIADGNDAGGRHARALFLFLFLKVRAGGAASRAGARSGVQDAGVLLDRVVQVGGGDGERGVQAVQVLPVPGEPGAGILGGRVAGQGASHGSGAAEQVSDLLGVQRVERDAPGACPVA